MSGFTGRRAIVTGGAHGIGAAICAYLCDRGADVITIDIERPQNSSIGWMRADLADAASHFGMAMRAAEMHDGVDILINCAGTFAPQMIYDFRADTYHRVLTVNLHAPVVLMSILGKAMSQRGYGRIVNVTSIHARLSEVASLAYDVSKAGLEAATRTAALELADGGILVNAVAPGFVSTRMSVVDGVNELETDSFRRFYVEDGRIPLRRAASPAEVAAGVGWLASGENTYVTGQVMTIDGGLSARF